MSKNTINAVTLEKMIYDRTTGMTYRAIADKFGYPKSTVQDAINRIFDVKEYEEQLKINAEHCEHPYEGNVVDLGICGDIQFTERASDLPLGNYDEQLEQFLSWIGKSSRDVIVTKSKNKRASTKGKIATLVETDWHIPFHNKQVVYKSVMDFLAKHPASEYEQRNLLIGGDFLDGYEMNSYSITKNVTLDQEMAAGQLILEWLATLFDNIVMIDDNHLTGRWNRYMSKQLKPSILKMLSDNNIDPYNLMIRHLPNVSLARRTYQNGAKIGWFHVVGDCLVAHAETHSAVAMKPVMNVMVYFDHARKRLGIPEIRCFIEAHVHKLGGPYYIPGRDIAVFESGCVAGEEAVDYGWDASLKYKPIENGVIHLVQIDGRTIHNQTCVVRYPFEENN